MQINLTLTGDESLRELDALSALIDTLAGRGPRTEVRAGAVSISGDEALADVPNAPTGTTNNGTVSQPAASVDAGAPTHDSAGIAWDERIHSASRATVADGTWRRRKNTPDDLFESVMAELRAASGNVPSKLEVPPATTINDTPEPPLPSPAVTEPVEVAAVVASEPDVPPPPPATDAPATGPDLSSWPKFVQSVQDKDVDATAKTYAALNTLSETFGADKFLAMRDKSDKWAMFYDMVG